VEPVQIDFGRVMARLPALSLAAPSKFAPVTSHAPAATVSLPPIAPPTTPNTLNQRREQAHNAIQKQRDAVRERLLQVRLEPLPALEQRWYAELQAEYNLSAIRTDWAAQWREAFEQHGGQRFTLLAEMARLSPDSERFQSLQQQLSELDARWQGQEQALRAQLEARLQRVEQEIEVRLRARRRDFIRQVEQEVDQLMRQQPDLGALYLPAHRQPSAPTKKTALPTLPVKLQSIDLSQKVEHHRQSIRKQTERILHQMANEWAQQRGYRLSGSPAARDATDEFLRYLVSRR
jgi:CHASE3 domain sensor protein